MVKGRVREVLLSGISACALFISCLALAVHATPDQTAGPYVPTPMHVVRQMLVMASVGIGDRVVDLGSGDGRVVITAAKEFGAAGFGVDIDEALVAAANENARRAGVTEQARFFQRDLFDTILTDATVVTVYILPEVMGRLEQKLLSELAPGTRVVSHDFPFPNWKHERFVRLRSDEKVAVNKTPDTVLYLYLMPANLTGTWVAQVPQDVVSQGRVRLRFGGAAGQTVGTALLGDAEVPLRNLNVRGAKVNFQLKDPRGRDVSFRAVLENKTLNGTLDYGTGIYSWTAASE